MVMAAIGSHADKALQRAREEERHEPPEAYLFDVLVSLATSGCGQVPKTEIVTRGDLSALLRG